MRNVDAQVTKMTKDVLELQCKPEVPEKVIINEEIYVMEAWYQEESFVAFVDNLRKVFSTILTLSCVGLICYAIGRGYAALEGNPILLYVIFCGTTTLLGYLEGLQICILALERVSREPFKHMKRAYNNHRIATGKNGLNVQRFLVGRQFFVVFVVFLNAQVTTYTKMKDELSNMPYFLFVLIIETGLPGALTVLAFGQLMPQLIASTHPVTFLNLPGSWFVLQLCLCFESVGVTHFSWVLTMIVKKMFGMTNKEDVKFTKSGRNSRIPSRFSSRLRASRYGNDFNDGNDFEFNSFICVVDMDVSIMPGQVNDLYKGAQNGMEYATAADLDLAWASDSSCKQLFRSWGFKKENSNRGYPTPEEIVNFLVQKKRPVPRYLLPKGHEKHIPPHIVVMELVRRKGDFCLVKSGIEA